MTRALVALIVAGAMSPALAATPYQPGPGSEPGQKRPGPEEMKQMMDMTFGVMVPMMGKMTEAMIEASLRVGERKETAESMATFKKNLYDALIKAGFSKEEAFQIMLNSAVPTAAPPTK